MWFIADTVSQLNPAEWLSLLRSSGSWDQVNSYCKVDQYGWKNYNSCFKPGVYDKLDTLLNDEIQQGKLTVVNDHPHCVHALGAIVKSEWVNKAYHGL